jgi:hypothetical protein
LIARFLNGRRARLALAGAFAATLVATFTGANGTHASVTTPQCNSPEPTGRLFCVIVEDQDGVSPSLPNGSGNSQTPVKAFQYYKLTYSNPGGSTLTNGVVTLKLTDNVPGSPAVDSTAVFAASGSAPFCSVTSTKPNVVTCTLGNIAAGGTKPSFFVAYQTSNTPGVTSTDAQITSVFKENTQNGANPSSLTFTENTSLEPNPELSVSWAPPGQHVDLGTAPDITFSKFSFDVPTGKSAFLSSVAESSASACDPSLTCFGQLVKTNLSGAQTGTFSSANPFHLSLIESLDIVPGNTNSLAVSHQFDDGTFEVIQTRCSSDPPAPSDTLPCFKYTTFSDKVTKQKYGVFSIWGFRNGGWMAGG